MEYRETRGESAWEAQSKYTRVVVTGAAIGIVATVWAILGDAQAAELLELLESVKDLGTSAYHELAGGGGLGGAELAGIQACGGGGLA